MRVVLKVGWHECFYCGQLFFANATDSKKYLNYQSRERKIWDRAIRAMVKDIKDRKSKQVKEV